MESEVAVEIIVEEYGENSTRKCSSCGLGS